VLFRRKQNDTALTDSNTECASAKAPIYIALILVSGHFSFRNNRLSHHMAAYPQNSPQLLCVTG
jgi:hypothetical protein